MDDQAVAGALLAGGVLGDVVGYRIARGWTDAEAHGVSHGAFAAAGIGVGTLVASGMWQRESSRRVATALVIGAGAVGYPLGLRYARNTSYRVTAGDVGTLIVGEVLGTSAVATFIPRRSDEEQPIAAALTAGFAGGAIAADRFIVRRFDYGEAESRQLQLGTVAGAVVGLVVPVLARSDDPVLLFGPATLGGLLGAIVTHNIISPARANATLPQRSSARTAPSRVAVHVMPQNLLLLRGGREGTYPVLNVRF